MRLSRRDMFKLGGLVAVGAAGLAIPLGNTVSGASASLLPTSKMPKPYQAKFERLEVLAPVVGGDAQGPIHYYDITAKPGAVGIVPGMTTPVLGYDGLVPAKRIDVEQGTRIVMTMRNKLRDLASHVRHPDADLHPSTRVGVAAAVRRVRQRHHRPRAEEDLPVPEHPGRPHPVVPRPRCALHRAERLLRPGFPVSPA